MISISFYSLRNCHINRENSLFYLVYYLSMFYLFLFKMVSLHARHYYMITQFARKKIIEMCLIVRPNAHFSPYFKTNNSQCGWTCSHYHHAACTLSHIFLYFKIPRGSLVFLTFFFFFFSSGKRRIYLFIIIIFYSFPAPITYIYLLLHITLVCVSRADPAIAEKK